MSAAESKQFSNISTTTAAFTLLGGKYGFDVSATFGGGKRHAAMNAARGNIGLKLAAGYGAALGSYSPAGAMLFGGR
jgi:microcystin-dependent protein